MTPTAIETTTTYKNDDLTKVKSVITTQRVDNIIKHGSISSDHFVDKALKERIDSVDANICAPGEEDPFYVADIGRIYRTKTSLIQTAPAT